MLEVTERDAVLCIFDCVVATCFCVPRSLLVAKVASREFLAPDLGMKCFCCKVLAACKQVYDAVKKMVQESDDMLDEVFSYVRPEGPSIAEVSDDQYPSKGG